MPIKVCLQHLFDLEQTGVVLIFGFLPQVYSGSLRPGEFVAQEKQESLEGGLLAYSYITSLA